MTALTDDEEKFEVETITVVMETSEQDAVGTDEITVGDGVTATLASETGTVEFYSNGGTLWRDWGRKSGIDANSIKSIKIASGSVYLPEDSRAIFSPGYYDEDEDTPFTNLEELDLRGFDTSYVVIMKSMVEGCSSLIKLDLGNFDTSNVSDICDMFSECI